MEQMMYAVCVKPSAAKKMCIKDDVWVKDNTHEYYVSKEERGLWPTRQEAEKYITEPHEIVVEVKGAALIDRLRAVTELAQSTAEYMMHLPDPAPQHAQELFGAVSIVGQWIEEFEDDGK